METKHCGCNYTTASIDFYRKQSPPEHLVSVNALAIDLQMTSLEAVTDGIGFGVLLHSV